MAFVGPAQRYQGVYCREHWSPVGYPRLSMTYNYQVQGTHVSAVLTEVYKAETNVERQVAYVFEIPPEAAVHTFSAQLGNTMVTAVVKEKSVAQKDYDDAVSKNQPAWKLDQLTSEIFQISLGAINPNDLITIRVGYVHLISSDTLEDTVRLTIPAGLASKSGAAPVSQTTAPTAIQGNSAVTITVGINTGNTQPIMALNSLSHHAEIITGFSTTVYKTAKAVDLSRAFNPSAGYVEFKSNTFLTKHFVLVWRTGFIDLGQCLLETYDNPKPGEDPTLAFAATIVSNIRLPLVRQEFLFLVDTSQTMSAARSKMAEQAVNKMLNSMPGKEDCYFNVYRFNTNTWSVTSKNKSEPYDTTTVGAAVASLKTYNAQGAKDINKALSTVISQRRTNFERTTVILITDGLDWSVTAALNTVTKAVREAANSPTKSLFRVFILGLGDDVSRAMCEGLARVGLGATAYISESQLNDSDQAEQKAAILQDVINRAPIEVKSIDWGIRPAPAAPNPSGLGDISTSRPDINQNDLGPVDKGDNGPEPPAIQQAPKPGTMFNAIRSNWYAIIRGTPRTPGNTRVRIMYDIPGVVRSKIAEITAQASPRPSRIIHTLAAHALIQNLEDKINSPDPADDDTAKNRNEVEVIRLGKKYSLASSLTSFIATSNGIGTQTQITRGAAPASGQAILNSSLPAQLSLNFLKVQEPPTTIQQSAQTTTTRQALFRSANVIDITPDGEEDPVFFAYSSAPQGEYGQQTMDLDYVGDENLETATAGEPDELEQLLATQASDGSFTNADIESTAYSATGVPNIPTYLSSLSGREQVKGVLWATICAVAFMQKRFPEREYEWEDAKNKALKYVKQHLHCIFGVDSARGDQIVAQCLDEAEGYVFLD